MAFSPYGDTLLKYCCDHLTTKCIVHKGKPALIPLPFILFAYLPVDSLVVLSSARIALPEGCKRDDVKLTVTPENALSVSFRSEDRALSKDVRLPCDAVLSAISARFKPEEANHAGHVTLEGYVSDLEVVVGRATSPEPKVIEIS